MSLNKFKDTSTGEEIELKIGCAELTCTGPVSITGATTAGDVTADKLTLNTDDAKTIDFDFTDRGTAGYVLHTDGVGGTYWGPDVGAAAGISYSGPTTTIGNHLKSASVDGRTAEKSVINESATELNLATLRVTNATDPTNPQDLTTKNYVDNLSLIDVRQTVGTGLLSGGTIFTNADTTKFDIGAGIGMIVSTAGVITSISWAPILGTSILGQPRTYIGINSSSAVVTQATAFTPTQTRTIVQLGYIESQDLVNRASIHNAPNIALNDPNSLIDLARSLEPMKLSGLLISATTMTLQTTSGDVFSYGCQFNSNPQDPHRRTVPARDTAVTNFRYVQKNGTFSSLQSTINPNNYDTGTNYPSTAVTAGYWTVQRVYVTGSDYNRLRLAQGQYQYATHDEAVNAVNNEDFTHPPNCAIIGFICVQQGTTDLANATIINSYTKTCPQPGLSRIANFQPSSAGVTTITGNVRSSTAPATGSDLVNKTYVDGTFMPLSTTTRNRIQLRKSVIQNLTTGGSTIVTWNSTDFNTGMTAGANYIQANTAGLYVFGYTISFDVTTPATIRVGFITVGNSLSVTRYGAVVVSTNASDSTRITGTGIANLNATDRLYCWAADTQATGGAPIAIPLNTTLSQQMVFWAYRLADL